MTTSQKAELVRRMQRLDYDMRLRHYPATYESADRCATEGHVLVGTGDNRVVCDECGMVEYPVEVDDPRDSEQFFLEQQCPSDRHFGR